MHKTWPACTKLGQLDKRDHVAINFTLALIVATCTHAQNLARLASKIMSPTIFAHVRAAYPGMPVSENNCHPFASGRYLWMHSESLMETGCCCIMLWMSNCSVSKCTCMIDTQCNILWLCYSGDRSSPCTPPSFPAQNSAISPQTLDRCGN